MQEVKFWRLWINLRALTIRIRFGGKLCYKYSQEPLQTLFFIIKAPTLSSGSTISALEVQVQSRLEERAIQGTLQRHPFKGVPLPGPFFRDPVRDL